MTIHTPWFDDSPSTSGLVDWYTGGALNNHWYANVDRLTTPYGGAQDTWELWCFTKDNASGLGKIYRNGNIVAAQKFTPYANKFDHFDLNLPRNGIDNKGLVIGADPGVSTFWGSIDELAIFDSDLSPNDVDPNTGVIIPGVSASRFEQMYAMGIN